MPEPRDVVGSGPFACFDDGLDEHERAEAFFEQRFAQSQADYAERLTLDNPSMTLDEAREAAAGHLAWIRRLEAPERDMKLERAARQLRKELDAARAAQWQQELWLKYRVAESASSLVAHFGRWQRRGTSREHRPTTRRTRSAAKLRGDPDEPPPPNQPGLAGRLRHALARLFREAGR
jgi:hypothetical protein